MGHFLNQIWVHYDPNTKESFRLHVISERGQVMILTTAKGASWILITLRDVLPVAQLFAKGEWSLVAWRTNKSCYDKG